MTVHRLHLPLNAKNSKTILFYILSTFMHRKSAERGKRNRNRSSEKMARLTLRLVAVLAALLFDRFETGADFHAFHSVNAHHGVGNIGVELVINRLAQTNRDILCDHFDAALSVPVMPEPLKSGGSHAA